LFYEVWDYETWLQTVRLVEEARPSIMAERPPTSQHGTNSVALQ
jgi:hypothetical protein